MNKRLKYLREEILLLSQEEFAQNIDRGQDIISLYENNKRPISQKFINLICDKYNVNENWLKYGEGPILVQRTQKDEMKDKISKIIDKLDEEEISILQGIAEKIKGII